jgi:hypothetical protein
LNSLDILMSLCLLDNLTTILCRCHEIWKS